WKNVNIVADEPRQEEIRRGQQRLGQGLACTKLAPETIPDSQQKMIEAFHAYAKVAPDAPEIPVMIYREADIYYDHNRFEAARPLFLQVIQQFTKHELAPFATNLYLDALNMECKPKEVVAWAKKFIEMPVLMANTELAETLIKVLSDGYELEAREYEKLGDAK